MMQQDDEEVLIGEPSGFASVLTPQMVTVDSAKKERRQARIQDQGTLSVSSNELLRHASLTDNTYQDMDMEAEHQEGKIRNN